MITHPSFEELNDYADGVLADDARRATEAHLARCADCATSLDDIRALQQAAHALPRSMTPPDDVWQAVRSATIDNAFVQRRRVLWQLRYPLAAAAIVLLVLGSSITWYFVRNNQQPQIVRTEPAPPQHTNLVAYRAVEAEYGRAAGDLMQLLDARRANMDTAIVRSVEENLRVMDDAIAKARAALLSDPSNRDVAGILTATQESKLRMLRRAVGATGGI